MYEEIIQPKRPKWYHGILFCAALILAILAVLFIIQILKTIFKEADAVIFDLLGIAAMARYGMVYTVQADKPVQIHPE